MGGIWSEVLKGTGKLPKNKFWGNTEFWLKIIILKSNCPIFPYDYIKYFVLFFKRVVWTFYQGGDWYLLFNNKCI